MAMKCTIVIINLKKASPGIDKISAQHLKLVVNLIYEPLSVTINLAIKDGILPNSLKVAKVLPVYKKGDRLSDTPYHPICILSSLSKVIKKLFIIRLSKYLQKFNLLKPCQFAFREGSSTNLAALLSLTDYVKRSINSGCVVGSAILDFAKAFDTLNHLVLSNKLEAYGISGPALKFLKVTY